MHNFKHIAIVGCGLIGGSFALAVRRAGLTARLTAYGGTRSPQLAVKRGVVDAIEKSFAQGKVCQADLIYLAAPIGGIIDFLRKHGQQIRPGTIVTDAGSTKAEICRVARATLPAGVHFIGGHPMAGAEHTGVEYAHADLFDRATYALTVEPATDAAQLQRLKALIETFGARVQFVEAEAHDVAVAMISHLPQLIASTLATLLSAENAGKVAPRELAQHLAAGGWRDMTRLAGSSWSMWRDICLTNQPNIAAVLGEMIVMLEALKEALDVRDFNHVSALFTTGNHSLAEQRALHYHLFDKL